MFYLQYEYYLQRLNRLRILFNQIQNSCLWYFFRWTTRSGFHFINVCLDDPGKVISPINLESRFEFCFILSLCFYTQEMRRKFFLVSFTAYGSRGHWFDSRELKKVLLIRLRVLRGYKIYSQIHPTNI